MLGVAAWVLAATAAGGVLLIALLQASKGYARLRWPVFSTAP